MSWRMLSEPARGSSLKITAVSISLQKGLQDKARLISFILGWILSQRLSYISMEACFGGCWWKSRTSGGKRRVRHVYEPVWKSVAVLFQIVTVSPGKIEKKLQDIEEAVGGDKRLNELANVSWAIEWTRWRKSDGNRRWLVWAVRWFRCTYPICLSNCIHSSN